MDQLPHCEHYDAKDPELGENCSNCTIGLCAQCLDHLILLKRWETQQKLEAYEYCRVEGIMDASKGLPSSILNN